MHPGHGPSGPGLGGREEPPSNPGFHPPGLKVADANGSAQSQKISQIQACWPGFGCFSVLRIRDSKEARAFRPGFKGIHPNVRRPGFSLA